MNKSDVQFIEKDGKPQFVVIPIEKYKEFLVMLDDIEEYSAIDQMLIDYQDGDTVPGEIVNAILKGSPPLRAWREYRGFTLDALANRIGGYRKVIFRKLKMVGSLGHFD